MATGRPCVLVAGATGQMGRKIVRELGALGVVHVRALHRGGADIDALHDLGELGAELVAAELDDVDALARSCRGVAVVVSALQGLEDVIVEGQARLLRAAARAGVTRMIPSDYTLDYFRTAEGDNQNLDLRRTFARVLDASPLRGTSVLCGAFMDMFAYGAMGPDRRSGLFRVWGDPDQPADFTLSDDVARYVARVAIDDEAPRVVRIAGDTRSAREIASIFEDLLGMRVRLESAGSLDALSTLIEKLRAAHPADRGTYPMWQRLQIARDMQSGRGRFESLDNARYADVQPLDLRSFLTEAFEGPASDRRPILSARSP